MPIPVQITFHGLSSSDALRQHIAEHAQRLERYSRHIIACEVVVEHTEKHHHKGNRYRLRVHLRIPGEDIQASRGPGPGNKDYEDPYVAMREAFDAVRRQLEDHERERRRHVKSHEPPDHGEVSQMFPAADYGVIRTPDGRDVSFHRHSVVDGDFDRLAVGNEVRFTEIMDEEGPWASTVHAAGRHHPPG